MRHGIDMLVRRKTGAASIPDLYRVIYRPRLYAGTKVEAKLDRTSESGIRDSQISCHRNFSRPSRGGDACEARRDAHIT